MNGITVQLTGMEIDDPEKQPLLVTIVRNDESGLYGDAQSCHLFAFTGKQELHKALQAAIKEYIDENGPNFWHDEYGKQPIDWFGMMAEREDHGEIFAKHGLTEITIPMGMVSLIFDNNDPLQDYLESR